MASDQSGHFIMPGMDAMHQGYAASVQPPFTVLAKLFNNNITQQFSLESLAPNHILSPPQTPFTGKLPSVFGKGKG